MLLLLVFLSAVQPVPLPHPGRQTDELYSFIFNYYTGSMHAAFRPEGITSAVLSLREQLMMPLLLFLLKPLVFFTQAKMYIVYIPVLSQHFENFFCEKS